MCLVWPQDLKGGDGLTRDFSSKRLTPSSPSLTGISRSPTPAKKLPFRERLKLVLRMSSNGDSEPAAQKQAEEGAKQVADGSGDLAKEGDGGDDLVELMLHPNQMLFRVGVMPLEEAFPSSCCGVLVMVCCLILSLRYGAMLSVSLHVVPFLRVPRLMGSLIWSWMWTLPVCHSLQNRPLRTPQSRCLLQQSILHLCAR